MAAFIFNDITDGDVVSKVYSQLQESGISDNLAIEQLWLVKWDDVNILANIYDRSRKILREDHVERDNWFLTTESTDIHKSITDKHSTFMTIAIGAMVPGDEHNIGKIGVDQTGALKGVISEKRSDSQNLKLSFIETNVSFVDTVLRPWMIALSHKGLKYAPLRTNIEITLYQLNPINISPQFTERKTIRFIQACPINIDSREYNYVTNEIRGRDVEFCFNDYYITTYKQPERTSLSDEWMETVVGVRNIPRDDETWEPKFDPQPNLSTITTVNKPKDVMIEQEKFYVNGNPPRAFVNPVLAQKTNDNTDSNVSNEEQALIKRFEPTPLQKFQQGVESLQNTVNAGLFNVKNSISTIQNAVNTPLRMIGMDETANRVDRIALDAQQNLKPIENGIQAGNNAANAANSAINSTRNAIQNTTLNSIKTGNIINTGATAI